MFWPPFAFIRGIFLISASLFGYPYQPITFTLDSEIVHVYWYLLAQTPVYLILAL